MRSEARPVIMARLIENDDKMFLENHKVSIELHLDQANVIKELYIQANGQKTLSELCDLFPDIDVNSFVEDIEKHQMVYDVMNMGMIGHNFCNYPDSFKPTLGYDDMVKLQKPDPDCAKVSKLISVDLDNLDFIRCTTRNMDNVQISEHDFESIVLSSYGITIEHNDYLSRVIPSAGAMHPLNHYFFTLNVENYNQSVYRMANQANALIEIEVDPLSTLKAALFSDEWVGSSVVHLITFDIAKSAAKYSSRAHRFALLEAGHSAQNSISKATALNIGSWEYGGYYDSVLSEAFGLDNNTAGIATIVFYGGNLE